MDRGRLALGRRPSLQRPRFPGGGALLRSAPVHVAILLNAESFEAFFEGQMGLSAEEYVDSYRNDWAWDYCAILRERGIDATIYVASLARDELRTAPDGMRVRFLPLGGPYRLWRQAPMLKRSPPGRWISQLAAAAGLRGSLLAAMRADGVDVLMVQEYWSGRFDGLAMLLDVPLIAVDQGLPDRHEIKLLKRRAMARCVAILTQTRFEAARVERFGGRALHVPNAVDTAFFRPDEAPEARERWLAVTLARLHDRQKRISDLIRAMALVDRRWRLDVYGIGPDEDHLRALASEIGAADRIRFRGFEPDKEVVRERLRRCGVFVLPSAWEGLPVALLEAMACGAAAVGSDIPAIAEVIENGAGLTAPVGDAAALADAIDRAGARLQTLSAASRSRVEERYSRERLGRELEAVLREAA